MSIPEPKVAHHHGRGIRSCPIFPELRLILDEAFEIFGSESEYVVATQRDAKNDSILAARREMQRRRRHAPSCMETTEASGNSQEVRYSQGKALFCSGGQGIRTPLKNLRESSGFPKTCDKSDAGTRRSGGRVAGHHRRCRRRNAGRVA
jgi:hypothetical protein